MTPTSIKLKFRSSAPDREGTPAPPHTSTLPRPPPSVIDQDVKILPTESRREATVEFKYERRQLNYKYAVKF
jgi:hypothetical protein